MKRCPKASGPPGPLIMGEGPAPAPWGAVAVAAISWATPPGPLTIGVGIVQSSVPWPAFRIERVRVAVSPVRNAAEKEVGVESKVGGGRVVPEVTAPKGPALPHSSSAFTAKK